MTSADGSASEPKPDEGMDELQADIAATREELGETVAALGDKLDVKARAGQKVADVEERVSETVSDTRVAVARGVHTVRENARAYPAVPAVIAGLAVVGAAVWLLVRRRRR